ncbi:MAG: molybdenum ABC transporter ATP-binding protein [Rhizomicrobium sp.]
MSIEVRLRHSFGDFSLDAAFRAERPGVTALFGASGSGKSTIVNAIAGLLHPQTGRVVLDGQTVTDTERRVFVPARLRRTPCVFQNSRLFPHLSVEKNLLFGWRRVAQRASKRDYDEILDLLGLAPLLARKPARLSGGEKGRVALGRALLASPRLLLLDEPLAALDAARKSEILPYLERLRDLARVPMIYVTHSTEEVARLADNLIVIDRGQVAGQGSVFDLLSDPELGPLVPTRDAVFPAIILNQRADRLTVLGFEGGELLVPHLERPAGTRLRVRLRADEVMLARRAPEEISANNVLAAQIVAVETADGDRAVVRLLCGNLKFASRITRASRDRLGLVAGQRVFAIVKSVTIEPQLGP